VVGRAADCELVVNHPAVSGQHCRLTETAEGFRLEDLHSSNGTYVNGRRIDDVVSVRRGDRVTLGQAVPMPWPTPAPAAAPLAAAPVAVAPVAVAPVAVAPASTTVIRVGRAPDNEVVLDYPAVSGHHARITLTGGQAWIEDLGSTNGTALGRPERKITRAPLSAEDVVFFGSLHVPAARLLHDRLNLGDKPCAVVAFRGRPIVFGRDPDCDQVLSYPMISGRHARLWRSESDLLLEDLGSSNGTFLNGKRIRAAVPVRPGDVIGLGSYTFKLTETGQLEQRDYRGNVTLSARGVTVQVARRALIEDISLTIFPGELVGLMGPSGAGKTTLMSALNGYTLPAKGEVLLNGHSLYEHYPRFAPFLGYVPQDDIIHRSLTVGQALYYTARLRLPSDYRKADIMARVRQVLQELGLEGVEDVLVGSPEKRGISGGQRKRVNLAMELLTDPLVLYLDEPTSGLSSEDALLVVRLLRRLADAGRTILLTIHQPGPEVFRLLDNVVVVARDAGKPQPGRLVYFGPAYPDAVRFFNPTTAAKGSTDLSPDEVLRGLAKQPTETWLSHYRASTYYKEYVEDRAGKRPAGAGTTAAIRPRPEAAWSQWWVLVCRCTAIKVKDVWNTAVLLGQAPLIALLIVIVYGRQLQQPVGPATPPDRLAEITGALGQAIFLMVLSALWFGCTNAVREIVGEWAVYRRERMVGLRLVPYVASKCTVLGALCVVQCLMLMGVIHWGCGLRAAWGAGAVLLLLVALVGVAIGLTISALARTSEVAIALLPLVLLPMIIFAGVLHPIDQMDRVPQLVCQVMPSRWAFEGSLVLEAEARHDPREGGKTGPDMAERSFPREGRRLGPVVSGLILFVFLGLLTALVHLILKARDSEVYRGRLFGFLGQGRVKG
jgi:ABC-type multidrug transport system ATPase subunit/pSer/pThr/pTyr-binding forkhead associated (FHA) protein